MSICAIENSFAKPPKFFTPKIPILCSQKTIKRWWYKSTQDTSNKWDIEIKEIQEKVQIPILDATPLAQHLCVLQTEREGESIEGVDAALWL